MAYSKTKIIVCNSHFEFAQEISDKLKIPIANKPTTYFANGEIRINITESVRNFRIFIIATGISYNNKSVNDGIMELYLMIKTCKRSDSKNITVLLPHFPYARQDKKDQGRASISARDIADLIELAGADRIVCMDLHNPCIQGFFNIPCDNIYPSIILKKYLFDLIFDKDQNYKENYIAISPDEGGFKRTSHFAKLFELPFVTMSKIRDYSKTNQIEKTIIQGDTQILKNKIAIIFDDIYDTGGTVESAVKTLKIFEVKNTIICVTHGLFSNQGLQKILSNQDIIKFICSNSVPQNPQILDSGKIHIFSITGLYSDIITRLNTGQSISELFQKN